MKFQLLQLLFLAGFTVCNGQKDFGSENLQQEKIIEMHDVSGRIDHLAINLKDNLIYVAALGNNSIEVVDLNKGAVIQSIKHLDEPQGVVYIPETNELVVANGGNGNCIFYNASTYQVVASVSLGDDADNIRYNTANGKIYVGYGNGGIAVIDIVTHKKINDVKLPAHPESFQIDQKHNLLFVNLPDNNSIAVIDVKTLSIIHTWKTNNLRANFPMTLDTANNLVIVGYRHPALLVSYDVATGKEKNSSDLVSDVDDVFYYPANQEVFASGGGGSINIFKSDKEGFKKIADISTTAGARTSLLIPALQIYILAERATGNNTAALVIYKINTLKK